MPIWPICFHAFLFRFFAHAQILRRSRYVDYKNKLYTVPIEHIKTADMKNQFCPQHAKHFDNKVKYRVRWYKKCPQTCKEHHNHDYAYYKATILSLGCSKDDLENNDKRIKFPNVKSNDSNLDSADSFLEEQELQRTAPQVIDAERNDAKKKRKQEKGYDTDKAKSILHEYKRVKFLEKQNKMFGDKLAENITDGNNSNNKENIKTKAKETPNERIDENENENYAEKVENVIKAVKVQSKKVHEELKEYTTKKKHSNNEEMIERNVRGNLNKKIDEHKNEREAEKIANEMKFLEMESINFDDGFEEDIMENNYSCQVQNVEIEVTGNRKKRIDENKAINQTKALENKIENVDSEQKEDKFISLNEKIANITKENTLLRNENNALRWQVDDLKEHLLLGIELCKPRCARNLFPQKPRVASVQKISPLNLLQDSNKDLQMAKTPNENCIYGNKSQIITNPNENCMEENIEGNDATEDEKITNEDDSSVERYTLCDGKVYICPWLKICPLLWEHFRKQKPEIF